MIQFQDNDKQTASEAKYGIHPDKDFDLCNVASSTDLTGLVPAAILDREENESYSELLEYQAQDITVPDSISNKAK